LPWSAPTVSHVQTVASGDYSLQESGDHFGLHYLRVRRILKQHRMAKDKIPIFVGINNLFDAQYNANTRINAGAGPVL
jgi:hypothetical protein